MTEDGLAWLDDAGLMWTAAKDDAADMGLSVEKYMNKIITNIKTFCHSGNVYDREELVRRLSIACSDARLTLLLGGKNVGKTVVLKHMVTLQNAMPASEEKRLVLYVDAGAKKDLKTCLVNGLASLVTSQKKNWSSFISEDSTKDAVKVATSIMELGCNPPGILADSVKEVLTSIVKSFWEKESDQASESLLDQFGFIAEKLEAFPILVIDEANVVLGNERD